MVYKSQVIMLCTLNLYTVLYVHYISGKTRWKKMLALQGSNTLDSD